MSEAGYGAYRLTDDPDRIVPPTGATAWLTVLVSAAMGFLAVFALSLLFATDRLADRWATELSRTATVRVATGGGSEGAVQTALTVLEQTPGVASARVLSDEERAAILEPWLGDNLPVEDLPIPALIEVVQTEGGLDAEGLRLRLSAEVPGAVLDDHTGWRRPLVEAAARLRLVGWVAVALILVSVAAMVTLAANAALAANSGVITVLRLVGARDAYVARAFTRRFAIRAATGAAVGTVAGLAVAMLLPSESASGFLTGLRFEGTEWIAALVIPVLSGLVAFGATRTAAMRRLRETP